MGAAIEAASFNVPAMAISLETPLHYHFSHSEEVDFTVAGHFTGYFASMMLNHVAWRESDVIKVEVPFNATNETPWRLTRLARQNCYRAMIAEEGGVRRFSGYARGINMEKLEPDSDAYAMIVDQVVAVTPLTIDLTAYSDLSKLKEEFG